MLSEQYWSCEAGDDASSDEARNGKVCPVCPLPVKDRKRYCAEHHSAFETLQRHSTKPPPGKEQKVKKKLMKRRARAKAQAQQRRKSKGKSDEASKQSSDSSEMPMTDEHKAFIGIFGEGKRNKGDQMTANRVLLDYAAKFPKGAKANTKKRGSDFLLTNYMQAKGIAMRKRTRSSRPKMDYEAFVMEMKNRRGWHSQRADLQWKQLDTPENFADDNGPKPLSKRLRIPSYLVCVGVSEAEEEAFELKQRVSQSKGAKNADKEAVDNIDKEMSMGFSGTLKKEAVSIGPGNVAFTFQTEQTSTETFLQSMKSSAIAIGALPEAAPEAAAFGAVGAAGAAGAPGAVGPSGNPLPSPSKALFDIRSSRLSLIREHSKKVGAQEKKVADQVAKVACTMDAYVSLKKDQGFDTDEEFMACGERLQMSLLWLNREATIEVKTVDGKEIKTRSYEQLADITDHGKESKAWQKDPFL